MDRMSQGITRRQFLIGALSSAFAAVTAGGVYALVIEPDSLKEVVYDLSSPKWPKQYKPLRCVIIADPHVGCPSMPLIRFERIVEQANALAGDVILLLGDYLIKGVVGGEYVPPQPIGKILGGLTAPLGVYAVLGNHDWWKDGEGMWQALEENGIKVLENDAIKISREGQDFWIAGLADDITRKPDAKGTFAKISGSEPVIALCHDPVTFFDIPEHAVVTLAGHTHGGQVRIPFLGPVVNSSRAPLKYSYGHIAESGKDLIVSAGIGTSILPFRFNAPPEIVTLTIRPA